MASIAILVVLALLVAAALVIAWAPPERRAVRPRRHGGPRETGLPPGRVVYSDADGTAPALVARRYPLTGKPDYVIQSPDGRRIPVEIKAARVHGVPRHEDVLQVATYLLILDDLYQPAPRYGLLRYADAAFEIPYTAELRAELLALLAEMQALDGTVPPAGVPNVSLCRACAFKTICDDATV